MPRDVNGVYTLPAPMPVQPRTIPVTNVFNTVLADVKDALNNIPGDALAPGSVDTAQLADNSVTNAKMADNAINTAELVDGAVTNDKTKLTTGVKIWGTDAGTGFDPSWIAFCDHLGNRIGYVGRGPTTTGDALLVTDHVDAKVRLQNQSSPGVWQDLVDANTERVYLPLGRLRFPPTQNPSTDPNTLDDYEEGSFTATVTCATPGNLSVSYTSRGGLYRKIGSLVYVYIAVNFTPTYTTASGELIISGLPFPCVSETPFSVSYFSGRASGTAPVARRRASDTSALRIADLLNNATFTMPAIPTGTNSIIILSGCYHYD